jgi:hypothetical protein
MPQANCKNKEIIDQQIFRSVVDFAERSDIINGKGVITSSTLKASVNNQQANFSFRSE